MSFLGKHYEKIILAAFLLIFIVSLVYLITVFSKSKETTEADLRVVIRKADYQKKFNESGDEELTEGQKPKYAALANLSKSQSWNKSENRNQESPVFTDLMVPFKAARCPGCEKIIPSIYFDKKEKCILCGAKLEEIVEVAKTTGDEDFDKDGMPDMFERQNGLNFDDASDKMTDKDEDGFPNFIEYKAKTKVNDVKSHPSLAQRLYLEGIKRKKIPMMLFNVMKNNSEDKEKWLVQIKVLDKRNKWTSKFIKLDETLKLDEKDIFKITDIIFKEEEKFNKRLNRPMKTNVSEIIIQNTVNQEDKPIAVKMKTQVYENLARIYLKDFVSEKTYHVKLGDSFTVGDSLLGTEKFTVVPNENVKDQDKAQTVTIQDEKGKKYTIGKESALQKQINIINDIQPAGEQAIGPADPRTRRMDMQPGRMMPPINPAQRFK